MDDSPLFPLLLIGGGVGIDPFVRAPRATRMHPFRDDGGHSDGTVVDEDDAENDVEDQESEDAGSEDRDDDRDDEKSEDAEQLGDRGKRALAAMKAKLKAEKAKRIAAEGRVTELESGGDENAAVQRDAETAAAAKANTRIVKAEIRVAAAGKLADPADALNFLDLEHFEVDDDGEVDRDEIAEAIEDLLESKPYLAAHGGEEEKKKPPKPDRSQGAGGKGSATTEQQFASAMARLL